MKKWFSFNSKTQRTEVVEPSKETFDEPNLLFWTRGLDQWVSGNEALAYFLKPIETVVAEPVVFFEEENKNIKPKEKIEVNDSTSIVCPVVTTASKIIKTKNIKKNSKKVVNKRKLKQNKKTKSIKKRPKSKVLKRRKKSQKK